ncbi:hypothetical protein Tco_0843471 [Tanacetum coccineum]|uniref:Reverse transcriptase domain-containing protein n=1 Tax=Tanacetum coccineum TaxID=301880 RepID=A0ABQ5B7Z4_9ASTR
MYDGSTDLDDHITRFVRATNQREWQMPVWCRMFQQTLDGPDREWFNLLPNGCIEGWADLTEKFGERFAFNKKTEEMNYIPDVLEVIQILAFMSNSKCPELARRFSDRVPKTVTEMMRRMDDFMKSEEAYKSTELPKGEHPEKGQGAQHRGHPTSGGIRCRTPED